MKSTLLLVMVQAIQSIPEQICHPDDSGVTICNTSSSAGIKWVSNITEAGGHRNEGSAFEVQWNPDNSKSGIDYAVSYRVAADADSAIHTLSTTTQNSFIIEGLELSVQYAAIVCQTTTINFNTLSPECGFCRFCFRIENRTAPTFISIDEYRVEDIGIGFRYSCNISGNSTPTVSWTATDPSNNQRINITNNLPGVIITTSAQMSEKILAELIIASTVKLKAVACTVTNTAGKTSQHTFTEASIMKTTDRNPTSEENTVSSVIIGIVMAIVVILASILTAVVFGSYLYYKKNHRRSLHISRPSYSHNIYEGAHVAETSLSSMPSIIQNLPRSLIIKPQDIEITKIIGQGEFGVVYKGFLKSKMKKTVAIKTLKGIFVTPNEIKNLSQEIEKMIHFDHPNVMSLIGVCPAPSRQNGSSTGPCMVMPYMANGSLLEQLQRGSEELTVTSEDHERVSAVKKDLVQMCFQIAKGMEYLAHLKCVHRDLAARNCLVDINGIIKVSDFGLAEDIYSQNYFRQASGGTKLPLKWMSLESIAQGKFTEKTDVWSYGVTCWEIFTCGSIPYPGLHPQEILEYLENGMRLKQPKNAACDSEMFSMMNSCWDVKDTSRPSFSDVVSFLETYLESTSDYLII